MHRRLPCRFNFIAAALLMLWIPPAMTKDTFTVAIVPLMAPTVINQNWGPFLRHLEKVTGHQFELRVYDQFDQFEREFKAGVPDFVYLNPYHAVMAKHAQGYIPLVRSNNEPLTAILVVQADGVVHQLRDLEGKTVAFASPNAFAPLYLRALLNEKEKITIRPAYVSSPQNAFRHVLTGDAAAGGGILPLLQKEPAAVQSRLKVLYTTPGVAPHPVAAHPRVPAAIRHQVQQAMLGMARNPETQKLLDAILIKQPIPAEYERDYAPLEQLHFDRYMTPSTP